ncbi:hypothetical protein Y032_0816g2504 [Ancylostoma ceylanicum]|uniref:ABC transmembrane type-1 domain-containing protein n=1 Tax=Ancylostoma ceylanicum TaxID=53326 RepID=A0A016WD29_9BILA|nr:hypothetical protein Y032_0816g2504 [Ancylostoma ceylanicum]
MEQLIDQIRQKELLLIRKAYLVRNVIDSLNTASAFMVALFSFAAYMLSSSSHELTPQVAFVSLTLFMQLRAPMVIIAMLIGQMVQAVVSNKRLKQYFIADELDSSTVERHPLHNATKDAVEFEDFSATWDYNESSPSTLQNINLNAARGTLIAVVGKVGSGKSSLLSALLGEMGKLRGRIGLRGKVAYVPQLPWIQNMTVRDNILFGKPFDKHRYSQVLSACTLKADLRSLANGDMTEIGEKVLGPHGLIRQKTRILVTHRLSYVKQADEIVVLGDGQIIEIGRYNDLMEKCDVFAKFVSEYSSKSKDDEEDDDSIDDVSLLENVDVDMDKSNLSNLSKSPVRNSTSSIQFSHMLNEDGGQLIKKELVKSGHVKLSVYHLYLKAASYWISFLFFSLYSGFQMFNVLRMFWLSAWTDEYVDYHENRTSLGVRLGVYGGLGIIESTCYFLSLVCLAFAALSASYNLHAPLLHNLLRSPMSFFDTTPLGRILNRCAKDIEVVDIFLPLDFRYLGLCILQLLSTLTIIVISTPIFVVVLVPLAIIYYFFLRFYVPTSRQLKRLESTHRSPIYSHFSETIQGAATIRAFNKVEEFRNASGNVVDAFIKCRYSNVVSNRWLAIRLEFIGNLVVCDSLK